MIKNFDNLSEEAKEDITNIENRLNELNIELDEINLILKKIQFGESLL